MRQNDIKSERKRQLNKKYYIKLKRPPRHANKQQEYHPTVVANLLFLICSRGKSSSPSSRKMLWLESVFQAFPETDRIWSAAFGRTSDFERTPAFERTSDIGLRTSDIRRRTFDIGVRTTSVRTTSELGPVADRIWSTALERTSDLKKFGNVAMPSWTRWDLNWETNLKWRRIEFSVLMWC
jgi:hypothetical protein